MADRLGPLMVVRIMEVSLIRRAVIERFHCISTTVCCKLSNTVLAHYLIIDHLRAALSIRREDSVADDLIRAARDNDLADIFIKYERVYIDEMVFNKCVANLKIDVSKLGSHLLTHRLVATIKQLDDIINPHHSACDQLHHLMRHVSTAGGKHGYFLLYVSLCESALKDGHQGHKDAAEELKKTAREMNQPVPTGILEAVNELSLEKDKANKEASECESSGDSVSKEKHSESGYESNVQPEIAIKSKPEMHPEGTLDYECDCSDNCTITKYENHKERPQSKQFPKLNVQGDSYEASLLEYQLAKETKAVKVAFADLRENTFRKLSKSCRLKHVLQHFKRLVDIRDCNIKTYEKLEDELCPTYCSWFNYDILKQIRRKFLFSSGKSDKALQSYEETFSSYCNRRCFESPCSFDPKPACRNMKSLVFKIDKRFEDYLLKDVLKIRNTVIDVINCPEYAVYVMSVQEGCVEVSCNILSWAAVGHLNQNQIAQLRKSDIISFKIEDRELMKAIDGHLDQYQVSQFRDNDTSSSEHEDEELMEDISDDQVFDSSTDSEGYDASSEDEADDLLSDTSSQDASDAKLVPMTNEPDMEKLHHFCKDMCLRSFEFKNEIVNQAVAKTLRTSGSTIMLHAQSAYECTATVCVVQRIEKPSNVEIDFQNYELKAWQISKLASTLGNRSNMIQVKGLDLSDNSLNNAAVVNFSKAKSAFRSLEKLILHSRGVEAKYLSMIVNVLATSFCKSLAQLLWRLDLPCNKLSACNDPDLSVIISQLTANPCTNFDLQLHDDYLSEVEKNFLTTMEESVVTKETVDHTIAHGVIVGPRRSGKSTLLKRLTEGPPDTNVLSPCIGVLENVVKVEVTKLCAVAGKRCNAKQHKLKYGEKALELMMTTAKNYSHSSDIPRPVAIKYVYQKKSESMQKKKVLLPSIIKSDSTLKQDTSKADNPQGSESITSDDILDSLYKESKHITMYRTDIAPVDVFKKAVKLRRMDALREHLESSWSLYLTNTGGQIEFQEYLPLLVCGPSIFFVTFPLHYDLDKPYEVRYEYPDGLEEKYLSPSTLIQEILQTLATIYTLDYINVRIGKEEVTLKPTVFIIGTHRDCLKSETEKIAQIYDELQRYIKQTSLCHQGSIQFASDFECSDVHHLIFAVNNLSIDDDDIKKIRFAVQQTVEKGEFTVQCSSSWLLFSLILREKHKSSRVLRLEDCFKKRISERSSENVQLPLTWLTNHLQLATLFKDEYGEIYFFPSAQCHIPKSLDPSVESKPPNVPPSVVITFKTGFCPRGIARALIRYLMTNEMNSNIHWYLLPHKTFRNQFSFSIEACGDITLMILPTHLEIALDPEDFSEAAELEDESSDSKTEISKQLACEEAYMQIGKCMKIVTSLYKKRDSEYFWTFYCTLTECKTHPHPAVIEWNLNQPFRLRCKISEPHKRTHLPKGYKMWHVQKKYKRGEIQLENEVQEKHLGEIADLIAEWEGPIADELKLRVNDVALIKMKYQHNLNLQTREAFYIWKKGSSATYSKLMKIFEQAGYEIYADELRRIVQLSSSETDDSCDSGEEQSQVEQPQTYPASKPQSLSQVPPAVHKPTEVYVVVEEENLQQGAVCSEEVLDSHYVTSFVPKFSPYKYDSQGDQDHSDEQQPFKIDHDVLEAEQSSSADDQPLSESTQVLSGHILSKKELQVLANLLAKQKGDEQKEDEQKGASSRALLFGTYKDEVDVSKISQIEDEIRKECEETIFHETVPLLKSSHNKMFIAIDNKFGTDKSEMSDIHKDIEGIIKEYFPPRPFSTSYLMFGIVLNRLNKPIVSLAQCKEIAKLLSMPSSVEEALWFFHHDIHSLMYYSNIPSMNNMVICDPQVIFESISKLIIDKFKNSNRALKPEEVQDFYKKCLFSLSHIHDKTECQQVCQLKLNQFIDLLKHLNILAEVEESNQSEPKFIMPALIKYASEDELVPPSITSKSQASPLIIRFKSGFMPFGIFCASVVHLITDRDSMSPNWKLCNNQVWKNKIKFIVDGAFNVTLVSRPRYIMAYIERHPKARCKSTLEVICSTVCHTIVKTLETVISNMKYKPYESLLVTSEQSFDLAFDSCLKDSHGDHLMIVTEDESGHYATFIKSNITFDLEDVHLIWFKIKGTYPSITGQLQQAQLGCSAPLKRIPRLLTALDSSFDDSLPTRGSQSSPKRRKMDSLCSNFQENVKGDVDVPQLQVPQKHVPQSSRGPEPSAKRMRADSPGSDVQGALSGIVTPSTSILMDFSGLKEVTNRSLDLIEWNSGKDKLRIYSMSAKEWKTIARKLRLEDETPGFINNLAKRHRDDDEECVREVFSKWFDNAVGLPNARDYPLSWEGLLALLHNNKLGQVATKLRKALTAADCSVRK